MLCYLKIRFGLYFAQVINDCMISLWKKRLVSNMTCAMFTLYTWECVHYKYHDGGNCCSPRDMHEPSSTHHPPLPSPSHPNTPQRATGILRRHVSLSVLLNPLAYGQSRASLWENIHTLSTEGCRHLVVVVSAHTFPSTEAGPSTLHC